jgi:hypothetical protein
MNEPRDEEPYETPDDGSDADAPADMPESEPPSPGATSYADYERGKGDDFTPLDAGPPRLVSLVATAAAALILLVAIAITVLSWPDWVGEMVGGEEEAPAPATEVQPAPDETP